MKRLIAVAVLGVIFVSGVGYSTYASALLGHSFGGALAIEAAQ